MAVVALAGLQTEFHARSAEADGSNSVRPLGYPAIRQRGGCQHCHLEPRRVPRAEARLVGAERLVRMSAAKDALLNVNPDVLCLQEVRDWDSVAALVSILPGFQKLVVSRFREMGSSGPLSIQQIAIASKWQAESAWSESFKRSPVTPPRGFSFVAIPRGKTMLLVYSVHFKSNRGEATSNISKREEAARQLLAHVAEMERAYSGSANVVTVIAGDFSTDPTEARFASEGTFALLREKFIWAWENIPLSKRVTNPANGRYPDAACSESCLCIARVLQVLTLIGRRLSPYLGSRQILPVTL